MAASSSSSSSLSLLPRPSSSALIPPRFHRQCRCSSSIFLCNRNPTVQARVFLDKMRSQEAAYSPIDPSAQCSASMFDYGCDEGKHEETASSSHKQKPGQYSLKLHSVSLLPLLAIATLPGAGTIADLFEPIAEVVRSLDLPDWLVHWGHPGNMAVVLFAMGGYGSYLGWQIRLSDDMEAKAKAKDLHPKLLGGMFFFFSLGATGGILSLLTCGKPIFESPHAVTGLSGLALLTIQTALTGFFESNPSMRGVHGVLGSGIMLLFLVHAVFGLQLGLSY
eukprot:c14482_g1_i1 orf=128-961(+)